MLYDEPGVSYDAPIGYNGETRPIHTTAWDPAYGVEVAALVRAKNRGFVHELDGVGTASFDLQREDADVAVLAEDSIVRFAVGGDVRFAARVGPFDQATVAPGEEPAEVRTYSLSGIRSVLDDAVVYPEAGLGRIIPDPDHRFFNWTSGDFDDSGWPTATVVKALFDWADDPYPSSPKEWPSALLTAKWVWAQAEEAGPPPQPVGRCLFRVTFDVPSQMTLRLYVSADDGFVPYFAGARHEGETRAFLWGETKFIELGLVDAGTYTLAFEGINIARDLAALNIAGIVFGVVEMTNGGNDFGDVLAVSDENTKVLAYPDPPPGMTPGKILRLAKEEGQARGTVGMPCLAGVGFSFDDDIDTDGTAWPLVDLQVPVPDTSVLALCDLLAGYGVEFDMGPNDLTLHAWVAPRGADLSATVTLARAVNLQSLRHRYRPGDMTVGVARLADGRLVERVQTGASRRKERPLQLSSAASAATAEDAIDREFADHADGTLEGVSTVVPVAGATPYEDFTVGDIVTEPDLDLFTSARRVWKIAVSEDETGYPIYEVTT